MNYFEEYRKAHEEMEDDIELDGLLGTLKITQAQKAIIQEPYLDRISAAADGIKETVLDRQQTMVLHGVEAIFTKPRRSTSWKMIAMTFSPSDELIEEHSKIGHPSVRIKVQEVQTYQDEADEVPF